VAGAQVIPPAPWTSEIDAVIWLQRAPLAIAGLIAYREGPVGPYGEAFVAPLGRRGAHVTFMAVDSEPSLAGGRGNWALPKEMAHFDGDPGTPGDVRVTGDGWRWAVTTRARRRAVPAYGVFVCAQPWPDGVTRAFRVTIRGRARLGSVDVDGRGRHAAVLVSGRQVVEPPAR
jgi:Acetoacetate decarboxylase (ADC)